MNKPYTSIAAALLALIAVLQFLRVVLGWVVTVNGVAIPFWVSEIAVAVSAGLALMLWRERG